MTLAYGEIMDTVEPQQPYVVVYIREFPLMSASDFRKIRDELTAFGQTRGLQVDEIFEEKLENDADAFTMMNAKLQARPGGVLILSSIYHLTGLGTPPLDILQAFSTLGVEVLISGRT